jgi:hypothetical protein
MTEFDKWYNDYSLCRDDEHITRWSMEKAFEAGAQSERDKHRWIPVTERLPETGVRVFIKSEFRAMQIGLLLEVSISNISMFIWHDDNYVGICESHDKVISWQPLPEA